MKMSSKKIQNDRIYKCKMILMKMRTMIILRKKRLKMLNKMQMIVLSKIQTQMKICQKTQLWR